MPPKGKQKPDQETTKRYIVDTLFPVWSDAAAADPDKGASGTLPWTSAASVVQCNQRQLCSLSRTRVDRRSVLSCSEGVQTAHWPHRPTCLKKRCLRTKRRSFTQFVIALRAYLMRARVVCAAIAFVSTWPAIGAVLRTHACDPPSRSRPMHRRRPHQSQSMFCCQLCSDVRRTL